MVAPTELVRTLCDEWRFIGVFKKLVCVYEELPQSLTRQLPPRKEPR